MNAEFCIYQRKSAGNLHIRIRGEFNGTCAWELLKILKGQRSRAGRVFIDTTGIGKVFSEGVALFKSHMTIKRLPSDWLYFKGKKGFKIAPDSSRVLIAKTCGQKQPLRPNHTEKSIQSFTLKNHRSQRNERIRRHT